MNIKQPVMSSVTS